MPRSYPIKYIWEERCRPHLTAIDELWAEVHNLDNMYKVMVDRSGESLDTVNSLLEVRDKALDTIMLLEWFVIYVKKLSWEEK